MRCLRSLTNPGGYEITLLVEELIVMLWANEIFDPKRPDTISLRFDHMDELKVMTVVGTRPKLSDYREL